MSNAPGAKRSATLVPLAAGDDEGAAAFLHHNLNPRIPAEAWRAALGRQWLADAPNHGFVLKDGEAIVGVFCAIYSRQWINGREERFCNPHSWCVAEPYRHQSMALVLAVVGQAGYNFTMLTPNPTVTEVFEYLRFKRLDTREVVIPINPSWLLLPRGARASAEPADIDAMLPPAERAVYHDHRDLPWLRHLAISGPDGACHLIYKMRRFKRLASARILHVSDAGVFVHRRAEIGRHLWRHAGARLMQVERRFLHTVPALSFVREVDQPRLFLSATLADAQLPNLYTELMALDL